MKLFSKWRHRKVLFLISLPSTPEFNACSAAVERCIAQLQQQGVDVRRRINATELSHISKYELVIVVAHHDEEYNALALADGMMKMDEFVQALPTDFNGVLDLASCQGGNIFDKLKAQCPSCQVQASQLQTPLNYRLFAYPLVIELINKNKRISYHEAYIQVRNDVKEFLKENPHLITGESVKLGKSLSTAYAPSQVQRSQPFMIQVFFHHDKDTDEVRLMAQKIDDQAEQKRTRELSIKLKKSDDIRVHLSFPSRDEQVHIDGEQTTQHCQWQGNIASVEYSVTLSDDFKGNRLQAKVMIEVNCEPIGHYYFNIDVVDESKPSNQPGIFTPFDKSQECENEKQLLLKNLHADLQHLEEDLRTCQDKTKRMSLEAKRENCRKCIEVIERTSNRSHNAQAKVFISSTGDLKELRRAALDVVLSLEMQPIMYEYWPQKDATPADVCCQKVKESNIFLCILGSRYGSDGPSGMSMTEFEYRTALSAGLPILVYVQNPLSATDEPEEKFIKQRLLIDEVSSNRILTEFSERHKMELDATRNLGLLKNKVS